MPTSQPKPQILPLNAETRASIHQEMIRCEGSRERAADALGVSESILSARIREDDRLSSLWGKSRQVDVIDIDPMDRAPIASQQVSPANRKRAAALTAQDEKIKKLGWEGIGVKNPDQLRFLQSLEQFVGGKIMASLDATHGGVLYAFAQAAYRFSKISERLVEIEQNPTIATAAIADDLHNQWVDCANLMKSFNDSASKAAAQRALIEAKARELGNKKKKKRAPGWAKAVNAK